MIVYVIRNLINGKVYVGQTIRSLDARWKRHCWNCTVDARRMPISGAIAKYGKDNFSISILCRCESQRSLDSAEIRYARKLNAFAPHGYNLKAGNGPGSMGPEVKAKIRAANTGRKATAQARHNMSLAHVGRSRPASTDRKLSEFYRGRSVSPLGPIASAKKLSKLWHVVSPYGEAHIVRGLAKFCREHDLNPPSMCRVAQGFRTHHHGWRVREIHA